MCVCRPASIGTRKRFIFQIQHGLIMHPFSRQCTHTHTHKHTHTHTHTCTCTHSHTLIGTHTHSQAQMIKHSHVLVCMHKGMDTNKQICRIHIYTRTHTCTIPTFIHTHVCTQLHLQYFSPSVRQDWNVVSTPTTTAPLASLTVKAH